MREVDEPLGNALTGLVVTDHHEPHAREHLGRADRRDMRRGVGLRVLALPHVSQVQDRAHRLGPDDAVGGEPDVRWNSRTARSVKAPKMPSITPHAKPSTLSACCSTRTSAPWKCGMRRYSMRSPSVKVASTSADHVSSPTSPSSASPCWLWKAANRLRGRAQEHAVDAGRPQVVAEREQAALDVFDGGPAI